MATVSVSASGTAHGNTVAVTHIKIMFQVFPGIGGTDTQRGIADVPYTITTIAGTSQPAVITGRTAADGGINLAIPAGDTATLTIFDTDYLIKVLPVINSASITLGQQYRLSLLGYEHGNVNDPWGKETDRAVLNFQADSNLDADGLIGNLTQNKLVSDFGE